MSGGRSHDANTSVYIKFHEAKIVFDSRESKFLPLLPGKNEHETQSWHRWASRRLMLTVGSAEKKSSVLMKQAIASAERHEKLREKMALVRL